MTAPCAEVRVLTERPRRRSRGAIDCVVGDHIHIRPQILAAYCFNDLSPVAFDLALIAASVAFIDRTVPRRPSSGWTRSLRLSVPVSAPQWRRPEVHRSLTETLRLLTGDRWDLTFASATSHKASTTQSVLRLERQGVMAMPYSDGLDSFAVARLLEARSQRSGQTLIRVTTGSRANVDLRPGHAPVRVAIPFTMSDKHSPVRLREASYRTRGFVYGALAGLAVRLAGGSVVVVPESGQSTFGPSLCPLGPEAVDVRSHPAFTKRLAGFLSLLLDGEVSFEHPQCWKTKGETLSELMELQLSDGWHLTHSCPRSVRHVRLEGKIHCGICAACLLRRQSVLRARLPESERYLWGRLQATSLETAAAMGARATSNDDLKHLRHGALCMEDMARLCDDDQEMVVRQVAADLASRQSEVDENVRRLRRLVKAHADEWRTFVAAQGAESFLQRFMEVAS